MEIIKGEKPDKGEIFVKKEKIGYALRYGNTCYKKKYDESVVTKTENAEECTLVNTENYLRRTSYSEETDSFLLGPIARNTIEKITILDNQEMGSNVISSWDVSYQGNNSILAWYKDEDENGLYELYIGQDGMVVANPDSIYLFSNLTNLIEINLDYLYTSNVTIMDEMFEGCSSLTELNLESFDTSNVTRLSSMFRNCSSLTELNISDWDTSSLKHMYSMFEGCSSLIELNLNTWDTSNITEMQYMFMDCSSLTKLYINNWDTSKVEDMMNMFYNCTSLTELNLSNWNTPNLGRTDYTFAKCSSLKSLNIKNFDMSNVVITSYMFTWSNNLTTIQANASIKDKIESLAPSKVTVTV